MFQKADPLHRVLDICSECMSQIGMPVRMCIQACVRFFPTPPRPIEWRADSHFTVCSPVAIS